MERSAVECRYLGGFWGSDEVDLAAVTALLQLVHTGILPTAPKLRCMVWYAGAEGIGNIDYVYVFMCGV